ncbi:MAG TPA: alpha/beta hydrolase [Ktedonobacterales bacterium]|nr:alpha/beta hydrolase [Ktedonobacterales bacterium]
MSTGSIWDSVPPRSSYPLLRGVRSRTIATSRLRQHIYASTAEDGERLLLVHGNASSARFFEELIASLPGYTIVAPDLRGYGASEHEPVDALRGLRDFSDDLEALVETLGWERFHLLGWSLGGVIVMQYAIDHPERVQTLTLHAPGSPWGYGGSHGAPGVPNFEDFAGSGGGLIAPSVIERYQAHDFTADSPYSPRSALRSLIVKPGFTFALEREDALVEQMLLMAIGDQYYPGDSVSSPNWPFKGPGEWGANNALSPKYCDLSGLAEIAPQPPILWARGADDAMVSDSATVDPAALGKLGVIPDWPGEEVCPPQPMLAQLRYVLDLYRANGGSYEERVFDDCGHAPLIEKADEFRAVFLDFLRAHPLPGFAQASPGAAQPADASALDAPATSTSTSTPISTPISTPAPSPAPAEEAPAQRRGPFDWFRRRP